MGQGKRFDSASKEELCELPITLFFSNARKQKPG